jgi:F-type H+-transporting ATPase subunit epsilon
MADFTWSVTTPDGPVASGTAEFLVIPTTRGELGVMAGHAALVACVAAGELRVTSAGAVKSISVTPGVVEVRDDVVKLLVAAVPASPAGPAA